ncbi:MAG: SIR2 family protein, partial [Thermoprotei archaeon]
MSSEGLEFADLLRDKGAVMLIGAGVSSELGYLSSAELASALAQDFNVPAGRLESVVKAILERGTAREEVVKKLREMFSLEEQEASRVDPLDNPYFLLSKILKALVDGWKGRGEHHTVTLITTNFDGELEKALGKELERGPAGYSLIVTSEDYSRNADAYVKVYKIHGDLDVRDAKGNDTLVLTEEDARKAEDERRSLYNSVRAALQEAPLMVIGHSFNDKDVQEIYHEARQSVKGLRVFAVNVRDVERIGEATVFRESSLAFFRELIDHMSTWPGFEALSDSTDYGVELSMDQRLEEGLKRASGKPVIFQGYPFCGKTMAVLRARKRGVMPEGYLHLELPKYPFTGEYAKRLSETAGERVLLEGSKYQVSFLKERGGLREPYETVEAVITEEDADRLFEYFAERSRRRRREGEEYVDELRKKKEYLMSMASWHGFGQKGELLIPPLLKRLIEESTEKDEKELKVMKELYRQNEDLFIEAFGLASLETVGAGSELASAISELARVALPVASRFLLPMGAALVGVSGAVGFLTGRKRDDGFQWYVKLHKNWMDLPLEKRKILCESLDEKYDLAPGDSYSFLSSWLSPESEGSFRQKLENVFTDDFIERLREVVMKYPELEARVTKAEAQIRSLTDKQEEHEKEIEEIKEDIRLTSLSSTELTLENLRTSLRLGDVEPIYSRRLLEKAKRIEEHLSKGEKVALTGEAMVGKTTLLHRIVSDILTGSAAGSWAGSNRVYTEGLKDIPPGAVFVRYSSFLTDAVLNVLSQHQGPALVEARSEDWKKLREAQGFVVVEVEREDYEGVLGEILRAKLKREGVSYTEEGVKEAVNASEGLVGYLDSLVVHLRAQGMELDAQTAKSLPEDVLDLIASTVADVSNKGGEGISMLYCLSLARERRLHSVQLRALANELGANIGDVEPYLLRQHDV